jgi:hypothetical protein
MFYYQYNQINTQKVTLVVIVKPEFVRRSIGTKTLPIIPDFHGPGSSGDSTGCHVLSAA